MRKIILDTDFLIDIISWKIDLISELTRIVNYPFKIRILDKTLGELQGKNIQKLTLEYLKNI